MNSKGRGARRSFSTSHLLAASAVRRACASTTSTRTERLRGATTASQASIGRYSPANRTMSFAGRSTLQRLGTRPSYPLTEFGEDLTTDEPGIRERVMDVRSSSGDRPLLILFCGLPGSGKTTIARQRETRRRAPSGSARMNGWPTSESTSSIPIRDSLQARLDQRWKELLERGQSVILEDGTWKRAERDRLRRRRERVERRHRDSLLRPCVRRALAST